MQDQVRTAPLPEQRITPDQRQVSEMRMVIQGHKAAEEAQREKAAAELQKRIDKSKRKALCPAPTDHPTARAALSQQIGQHTASHALNSCSSAARPPLPTFRPTSSLPPMGPAPARAVAANGAPPSLPEPAPARLSSSAPVPPPTKRTAVSAISNAALASRPAGHSGKSISLDSNKAAVAAPASSAPQPPTPAIKKPTAPLLDLCSPCIAIDKPQLFKITMGMLTDFTREYAVTLEEAMEVLDALQDKNLADQLMLAKLTLESEFFMTIPTSAALDALRFSNNSVPPAVQVMQQALELNQVAAGFQPDADLPVDVQAVRQLHVAFPNTTMDHAIAALGLQWDAGQTGELMGLAAQVSCSVPIVAAACVASEFDSNRAMQLCKINEQMVSGCTTFKDYSDSDILSKSDSVLQMGASV